MSTGKAASMVDEGPPLFPETECAEGEPGKVGTSVEESHAAVSNSGVHGSQGDKRSPTASGETEAKSLQALSRKEKRKNLKKIKRKQLRQEAAEKERLEEFARLQDPAEQLRIQEEERLEAERLEKERLEYEQQERLFEERERKAQEEFERKQAELKKEEEKKIQKEDDEDWRYVDDDGPAEIIWQGNEIIVKKKRVRVPAEKAESRPAQNTERPTSNPLPPQSAAFAAHKLPPPATPDVAEQNPAFGTEQDKTHCPFHIKTGVCRFGTRCSRVHVYPDHSFTLLIRNMYTGPGLNWDHDEGLEHSDEEVAEQYEEFYEDVHPEFLRYGELVNFKVCNNGSVHLRGNVYVHYETETAAQAAYGAMNGRFYAGKQITCEFVGVTRWKVALCGEYMKGHHKPCSHGSACNFLHCFRNPRGEYDWADWDSPPPRYWAVKMAKLFGYENDGREDDEYHRDYRKRRRSSERARSSERRHRSRDRYSRGDESEDSRGRRRSRHRSRDKSYHSSSDEVEHSSRQERRRHRRSTPRSGDQESKKRGFGDEQIRDDRWSNGHRNRRDSYSKENERYHEPEDEPGTKSRRRKQHAGRESSTSKRSRRSSRRSSEDDSEHTKRERTPKSPRKGDRKWDSRALRGDRHRHEPPATSVVGDEDRWRPDIDIHQ
ncbi:hypothetical protein R1sor_009636 [Riccia sorocarpa]|uniref:Uncharacterized protein n=1 Tax=Riccia sorocarpa TaxID=122646 RepID=A0ABD3HZ69_9MARC